MVEVVTFDTETKSDYPIKWGRHKYVTSPNSDMICMSWSVADDSTELWVPGLPVPEPFLRPREYTFYAHNINFDQHIVNTLGSKYGFKFMQLDNCVDVMAIAARFGYPQSLDKLGKVLKVPLQKMATGNILKKIFCMPPFCNPKKDKRWHMQKLNEFYEYCIRDNDSMKQIIARLPMDHLSAEEQKIWHITADINNRGVPIDVNSINVINNVIDTYTVIKAKEVPVVSDGAISTVGQTKAIVAWCNSKGVKIDNLQALTVDSTVYDLSYFLENDELDEQTYENYKQVVELLKLRQLLGGAAIKKFKPLRDMSVDGRIRDNARYYGAGTGRTTGGGVQFLNMPRAKTKYPEELIAQFVNRSILDHPNPLGEAKKLVRPMIKATKGKRIIAADWGSIEYILLMNFAGELEKVERFRDGEDPYIAFATKLFNVEYAVVSDSQRQRAKPPVLGSGYTLGWRGLIGYADGYGVSMSEDEAKFATNTWRTDHPLVVKAWYALKNCAQNAVLNPGATLETHNTKFVVQKDKTGTSWLIMTLPSGRKLYYCRPSIAEGKYGPEIRHWGIDPYTKQWGFKWLNISRLIENIIQALGRDILNYGIDRLLEANFTIIAHVYDEIICEEDEAVADDRLQEMIRLMCLTARWCKGLPLKADGFVDYRYRKN